MATLHVWTLQSGFLGERVVLLPFSNIRIQKYHSILSAIFSFNLQENPDKFIFQ